EVALFALERKFVAWRKYQRRLASIRSSRFSPLVGRLHLQDGQAIFQVPRSTYEDTSFPMVFRWFTMYLRARSDHLSGGGWPCQSFFNIVRSIFEEYRV